MATVLTPVSELVALGVTTANGKHVGVVILNSSGTAIDFLDSSGLEGSDPDELGMAVNSFTANYGEARWVNGYISITAAQFAAYREAAGTATLQTARGGKRNGKRK